MQRRTILGGLLAAPALIHAAQAQPAVLRVGDQRGGIQPLMEAAGVLAGAPFRVDWAQFAGAPMLLEALNAGAIDTGGIGDAPFTSTVAAGMEAKAVSAVRSNGAVTALVVPGASSVRSLADLRGKTVATLKGQTGHFLVLAALEREGLPLDAVRFAFIAPDAAKAALASGAVDGWATWGPYIALATVRDGAREIVNGGNGLMSGQSYQMAANAAIRDKRTLLTDFLHRLRQAREWGLARPDDQARVWSAATGFPPDVGRMVVDVAQTRTVPIDEGVITAQQRVSDFFAKARIIPRSHSVKSAFDPSFNEAIFAT